ncbi:MAG: Crp/Fnr family transcriptional regulator, partial [Candidatus Methylomirabilaceae bacterium]
LKGDSARSVYWLRTGLVKISVVWRDGRELILRLVRPGEFFGEASLISAEHEEHARALEASEIVEVAAEFVTQVTREPGAAAVTLRELALRLVETRQRARDLTFAGTLERLCLVLRKLATQLGEPDHGFTVIPHYITQEDVARMVGARREVVSSLLNRLREAGVITYSRKGALRVSESTLDRYLQGWLQRGRPRRSGE